MSEHPAVYRSGRVLVLNLPSAPARTGPERAEYGDHPEGQDTVVHLDPRRRKPKGDNQP